MRKAWLEYLSDYDELLAHIWLRKNQKPKEITERAVEDRVMHCRTAWEMEQRAGGPGRRRRKAEIYEVSMEDIAKAFDDGDEVHLLRIIIVVGQS